MDGAATAAIAWLPPREGSWGRGTRCPAPRSSCYKCALCQAALQRPVPSYPYLSLYERALSSGALFKRAEDMAAIQGLLTSQNTRRNNQTSSSLASRYDK